jgi:hypothetical protein
MSGLRAFPDLASALRAGYQIYDRTSTGYLVRTRTAAGWALAFVELAPKRVLADPDPEC